MATLTEEVVPYEVLVRFNQAGAYQGAHYETRTLLKRDGVVISDIPSGNPVAIGTSGLAEKDIRKLLDVAMAERIDALEAAAKDAPAAVERLTADLAEAQQEIAISRRLAGKA